MTLYCARDTIGLEMIILESVSWVAPIVEKTVENRLRWFGHVEKRHIDYVVRRVDQIKDSQITKGRGRPRKTIDRNC